MSGKYRNLSGGYHTGQTVFQREPTKIVDRKNDYDRGIIVEGIIFGRFLASEISKQAAIGNLQFKTCLSVGRSRKREYMYFYLFLTFLQKRDVLQDVTAGMPTTFTPLSISKFSRVQETYSRVVEKACLRNRMHLLEGHMCSTLYREYVYSMYTSLRSFSNFWSCGTCHVDYSAFIGPRDSHFREREKLFGPSTVRVGRGGGGGCVVIQH